RRPSTHPTSFGEDVDMRTLAERFVDRGQQAGRDGIDRWRMNAWACELRQHVEAAGSRLLVVELPMPAAYRRVRFSPFGQELRRLFPVIFCGPPVDWIDISSLPAFPDTSFADGIHLGEAAGQLFSTVLGCRVWRERSAPVFSPPPHGPH